MENARKEVLLHVLKGAAKLGEVRDLLCAVVRHEGPKVLELLAGEWGLPWALVAQRSVGLEP